MRVRHRIQREGDELSGKVRIHVKMIREIHQKIYIFTTKSEIIIRNSKLSLHFPSPSQVLCITTVSFELRGFWF